MYAQSSAGYHIEVHCQFNFVTCTPVGFARYKYLLYAHIIYKLFFNLSCLIRRNALCLFKRFENTLASPKNSKHAY